ncbi:MAG: hypothetical protein HZB53_16865 [Chloroflexi bacterium]|nr:hypothetical protein [Chloroflexota bacterium]
MTDATRPRTTYHGESLRAVAMPLGGIGTGTIALCGDGSLRQWQIHNQVNHVACVPHSFFALWARRARPPEEPVARVLQSAALYDTAGASPPPTANDHLVPQAHRSLLKKLPGVAETEFAGEYPIAELTYRDPALPLDVRLEAFSPFVPLDADDSGLPAILFRFSVSNPTDHAMLASLAACLQNSAGWDNVTPIFGAKCSLYGGNANTLARLGGATAIHMGTTRLPEDDDAYGTLALAADTPDATYLTQWEDLRAFWDDFSANGRLHNAADSTPSAAGRTWNGALAVPFALAPGETRTVTFTIAWHFPNRYVNWSQNRFFGLQDERSKFWLGNRYATRFQSALDVAAYVQANQPRLRDETRRARDTFYDTTLPRALIDAVTSQMSIIRSPSCFWAEDGRFYGFEGCGGASTPHMEPVGGCCPLNCTHVWNYEMALARLFPGLERTMREIEWDIQQHPSGYLPHRVLLPLYLPRVWDRDSEGPAHPALDGLLGAILKTYREYRACGDRAWLARAWPAVTKALDYIWARHDPERTGVITGEQPNTYDISIYGPNTFIGTLYLAALRAVEAMAALQGDDTRAAQCQAAFARGRDALDRQLWNGEYYIQDVDLAAHPEQNWGAGCHSDHLLGQWWAHALDLGHLLPSEHVRAAAAAIYRHNFRENFRGHVQTPRAFVSDDDQGLLLCTWPRGGRPAVPTLYSDEVWSGIEYAVAALLLHESETDAAVRIVEAVRARYDGRRLNPWNDIECGDHYVRAMSSWSLLEAASGYAYDAGAAMMAFDPRLTPADFRAPFFARDGWGTFAQRIANGAQTCTLTIACGRLELASLRLRAHGTPSSVAATVDGQPVAASLTMDSDIVAITFQPTICLSEAGTLAVTLRE